MKHLPKMTRTFSVLTLLILVSCKVSAQAGFSMTSTLCAGNTITVTAGIGTISASGYTWSSATTGPFFSSPNYSTCDISFPSAGVYTINLDISGSATSSVSHTITVHPLPAVTLTTSASAICVNDNATLTAGGAVSYVWTPTLGLYFFSNSVAYITPYVTTAYSVTGTSSLGCQGTVGTTVQVNPVTNLVATASESMICAGFMSTLTASGATNYTWTGTSFTGAVTQATVAVVPGVYKVIGANGGCKDSTTLSIGMLAPLSISVTASRGYRCKDDGDSLVPVNLDAAGATNYTWQPYNPGQMTYSAGSSTAVTPTISTQYTLTGATSNCAGSSIIYIQVLNCTALEEEQSLSDLVVFPNPVQDKLLIRRDKKDPFTVTILDMTGAIVMEKTFQTYEETFEISMETLAPGIYFICHNSPCETTRRLRVIKE